MTLIQKPLSIPTPVAERAAMKAKREKRRVALCRDASGEIRFLTVGEWTRRMREVERLAFVTPMGVFTE